MKSLRTPTTALVLALALTGCRLGNTVQKAPADDEPKPQPPEEQSLSGYYETEFTSYKRCVHFTEDTTPHCADAPREELSRQDNILGDIYLEMSNPVALVIHDTGTGDATLINPFDDKKGMSVFVNQSSGATSFYLTDPPETFAGDPECKEVFALKEEGLVHYDKSGKTIRGLAISGRMDAAYTLSDNLTGSCGAVLAALQACHVNAKECGAPTEDKNLEIQKAVKAKFAPFIDSGAMTVDEITKVHHFTYEIRYN